jgi:uncharacterized membrane protein YdbT with pleckstrin-like domain
MRYVNSTLNEGERVVLGPILRTPWEYLSIWVLLVIPAFFIWLRRWSTEYAVTSRRLVTKVGLVARSGDELRLRRIESVQVRQGLLGRILGYGDVIATGQGSQAVTLYNVVDPMNVKRVLEVAIEAAEMTPQPPQAA